MGPWWAASPSRRDGVGVQPEEERNKSQKKKENICPQGLGRGRKDPRRTTERAVGILIHCRSTGERERKSFFLSLCPTLPVHTGGRHGRRRGSGRWAGLRPRTNADTGARAPPPQFHWKVWGDPTVRCNRSVILDRSTTRTLIHQNHRRFLGRVETRSCDEVGDKFGSMVIRERPGPRWLNRQ